MSEHGVVRKPWPKVHLIYFLLAFFDLVAVAGGLYLSYRLSSIFEESVARNEEWGGRFVAMWNLGGMADNVNAPANNIFVSKNVADERAKMDLAAQKLSRQIEAVRTEITANVPEITASQPLRTLSYADQALATMVAHGKRTLDEFEAGNADRAAYSMALMDKSATILKRRLNESVQSVRQIQGAYGLRYKAEVESLKRYEYVIGLGIVLMVGCVVMYGHWVGSFMSRKYRELERAHAQSVKAGAESQALAEQLQAINEDVIRLNRDLEANLHKLRQTQDELVRKGKMAQLGQLTATVAHELRNPLGAVRTSSYLLERKLKGKDLGVEAQLDRITKGVVRCDNIITQLLDFARTSSLQIQTVGFDDWLANLVEEEAQKLPESLTVECQLGLGNRQVECDPARLSRVLVNLLSNASEAMMGKIDEPPVTAMTSPAIVVTTRETGRGIEFSVSDNGPGISEENLRKIFEPLFTTKNFGTGLGLPAVEKILEQHGGGMEVSSKPGEGACFTAWLPARQGIGVAA
jgi:signal transduction histidine kinase